MSVEKDIRYELLARLCPNSTGMYGVSVVPACGEQKHPLFISNIFT